WWESNPRPDKETTSFLHAYFVIGFHPKAEDKHPTFSLSTKFQKIRAAKTFLFPHFQHPLINLRRTWILRDVPLPHLVRN
ncbi:MAG: hypothetical protein ABR98_05125, partial [Cryomorphaceae bacterium BACL7 MAG-120910-bin2]